MSCIPYLTWTDTFEDAAYVPDCATKTNGSQQAMIVAVRFDVKD